MRILDYFSRVSQAFSKLMTLLKGDEVKMTYLEAYSLIGDKIDTIYEYDYFDTGFFCEPDYNYLMNTYWKQNSDRFLNCKNNKEYNQVMKELIEEYVKKKVKEDYQEFINDR